jgi:hypothetical protein
MKKKTKLFWRYVGITLVLAETAIYLVLMRNPFPWQLVRLAFMVVNSFIIAYLVQMKLKVEKHNAQITGTVRAKKS